MKCPQCRSRLVMQTLMDWDGCHDPNRKQCLKCAYAWRDGCWTCGAEAETYCGDRSISQEELEVFLEQMKA